MRLRRPLRAPRFVAIVGWVFCCAYLLACRSERASTAQPIQTAPAQRPAPAEEEPTNDDANVRALASTVHRGMCVAHNYQGGGRRGYGSETSRATLAELRSLGVDSVSLTPFGFMRSLTSTNVEHVDESNATAGETDARLIAEIRTARALGLRVLLKPHIWVSGGAWRGELAPPDWDGWFASYRAWILRYALLASREDVAILAIGTELKSSLAHPAAWRALIADIRAVFDGQLTYCANWDALERVQFFDGVDYVGVQFYPSIAESDSAPPHRALVAGHLDRLERLANGRPVLITEVGFKSSRGSAFRPHEWPERARRRPDNAAQDAAYRAFFSEVRERDGVAGIYLWKWFTDPDADEEGPAGFSPRGKPAASTLARVYARGTP